MNALDSEHFWDNVAFPLPYRVFMLIGLGILGWAANLHGLDAWDIDAVAALDLRTDEGAPRLPTSQRPHHHAMAVLAKSTYNVFLSYSGVCLVSWLFYRLGTRGDPLTVDAYSHVPVITAVVLVLIVIWPHDIFFKPERDKFIQAIRRCLFSSMNTPILFSDVVFADIGTSFAKVFGDIWLSFCMVLPGNTLLNPPVHEGLERWILPTVMSIPYFVRFRQCLVEYNLPSNESRRPFYNAIKYTTAFPVIYLSAAQRHVVIELVDQTGIQATNESQHGEQYLFRLWLLAVFVNSAYSFWWDITNDWGFELLRPDSSVANERQHPPKQPIPEMQSTTPLIRRSIDSHVQAPFNVTHINQSYRATEVSTRRTDYPFGLRPILLYPRTIYPLLIACNLVLRMSWSVKLSPHLHSARDGSLAVFWLEVAEIVRRWLWVFIRVEWEIVKKVQEGSSRKEEREGLLADNDDQFEMISPTGISGYSDRDGTLDET